MDPIQGRPSIKRRDASLLQGGENIWCFSMVTTCPAIARAPMLLPAQLCHPTPDPGHTLCPRNIELCLYFSLETQSPVASVPLLRQNCLCRAALAPSTSTAVPTAITQEGSDGSRRGGAVFGWVYHSCPTGVILPLPFQCSNVSLPDPHQTIFSQAQKSVGGPSVSFGINVLSRLYLLYLPIEYTVDLLLKELISLSCRLTRHPHTRRSGTIWTKVLLASARAWGVCASPLCGVQGQHRLVRGRCSMIYTAKASGALAMGFQISAGLFLFFLGVHSGRETSCRASE